ncbi:MAG TPA: thioredoxin family protein [Pirellulales bacterium]|nr:thioredoxin family protein [Pirellulales bacterium]
MTPYQAESQAEPSHDDVDRLRGPVVLEFGASWCPHCQAIQADLEAALDQRPNVQHLKIEDGRGKPLGRSFRVKLWPTLVFMHDGQVLEQFARPSDEQLAQGFEALDRG